MLYLRLQSSHFNLDLVLDYYKLFFGFYTFVIIYILVHFKLLIFHLMYYLQKPSFVTLVKTISFRIYSKTSL